MRKKALILGGSRNQTSMMHKIAQQLPEFEHYYTPFYTDTVLRHLVDAGLADFTIMGGPMRRDTEKYLADNDLAVDLGGRARDYDLVLMGTDLLVPGNIRGARVVLVQEGMTDPEDRMYRLVRRLGLPRFLASTATTGLSNAYDLFCVASEGYRDLFIRKGVDARKLRVTGIPNFDNAAAFLDNDFPHRGYVLAATSDTRECFKRDRPREFYARCLRLAAGRPLFFKLHPNENVERSSREIRRICPEARIFAGGNTDHMIANCDVLVTQYSSVVYVGLALGKEVHSYFDGEELRRLCPLQNGGRSAANIAAQCRALLEADDEHELQRIAARAAG
ncbi:MAG: hypothetical protein IPK64_00980 [bacterium]|nr:hypothetical protein [bacterium]